jgi:hypothetical protein
MAQIKHRYVRIGGSHILGVRLLSPPKSVSGEDMGKDGLTNRVFIENGGNYPIGSVVEFKLEVPGKGTFQAKGITEWSNDGTSKQEAVGIGIRLLEVAQGTTEAENEAANGGGHDGETGPAHGAAQEAAAEESRFPMPSGISEVLSSMLEREVNVKEGAAAAIDRETAAAVAAYLLDNGKIKVLWISNLDFIINFGAALAALPSDAAANQIKSKEIPDIVRQNFQEILNVSTNLFNKPDSPPVSLGQLIIIPDPVPDKIISLIKNPPKRMDLDAVMPGYGEGRIILIEV